ncbi:uncharacterized protein CBL_13500 [Carabus blaptoides fortunei]
MTDSVKSDDESSSESEEDLQVLRSARGTVQTYKPNFRKRALNQNTQGQKRQRGENNANGASCSYTADRRSQNGRSSTDCSRSSDQSSSPVVISSDSEDEAASTSTSRNTGPGSRQSSAAFPEISFNMHASFCPVFRNLTEHIRVHRQALDRSRLSHVHRDMWVRQQLDLENRRRYISNVRNSTGRGMPPFYGLDPTAFIQLFSLHNRLVVQNNIEMQRATTEMIDSTTSIFTYDGQCDTDAQNSCVICLNTFETGQRLRRLGCLHYFHSKCVDHWLRINKKCPICRSKIDERVPATAETN